MYISVVYLWFFSPNQQKQQTDNLTGQIFNLVQDKEVTKGFSMPMSWKI